MYKRQDFFTVIVGFSLFFFPSGFRGTAAIGPRDLHNQYPLRTHIIVLHERLGRMASCGPPPPRAAAPPSAAAATPGAPVIQAVATPAIEQR